MSPKPSVCREIQDDLVAVATEDDRPDVVQRVQGHLQRCSPCREEFHQYRAIEGVLAGLRATVRPDAEREVSRGQLEARLADLRRRLLIYRIFSSPLGRILIARSEEGVALVEYLPASGGLGASRLSHVAGVESTEDGEEIAPLYHELMEYLRGQRTRLDWPLDWRLTRSGFHRHVLEVTAAIPYGSVKSYAGIAAEVGQPSASRPVAQALRWNPLPIVVPCHRVIGSSGALVGYAGNRVSLKERLLGIEGIRIVKSHRELAVDRNAMYVSAAGDSEYCVPTCGSLASTTLARLTLYASREGAESAGLGPCTSCRPDLHPISR